MTLLPRLARHFHSLHLGALLIGAFALAVALPAEAAEADPPNILFILADDLGQETLGCYGGTSYETPRLDRLAQSGMRFDYAFAMPVCHPTRVAFLTGRYPFRLDNPRWGSFPSGEETRTVAHALKKAGYTTAVAGKWQLTLLKNDPRHPHRLGFDEYCLFGWHEGPRYWQPMIYQNGQVRDDVSDRYGPEVYTEFLIDFIERNQKGPFFAFYSMALCHDVTDDLKAPVPFGPGKDRYETYEEMVENMDRMVGRLVDALDRLQLRENTVVLFTADNGTPKRSILHVADGKLVREPVVSYKGDQAIPGGKGDLTDGGTQVPLIVNWPGTTPLGEVVDDLVDMSDYFATFIDLADAPAPDEAPIDGKSFAPVVTGRGRGPRDWAFAEGRGGFWVRNQRWKLYDDGRLYDLRKDPQEKSPVKDGAAQTEAAREELEKAIRRLQRG